MMIVRVVTAISMNVIVELMKWIVVVLRAPRFCPRDRSCLSLGWVWSVLDAVPPDMTRAS